MSRLAAALLPVLIAGCGAVPFDYHPGTEIPRGPGMLTGEDGAVIVRVGEGPEERKSLP